VLVLHALTVCLGLLSVALSTCLCLYFLRSKTRISRAFAYTLAGEAFLAAVTVLFALFAQGLYDFISLPAAMIMRWSMFLVATATSFHLAYQLRLIELQAAKNGDEDGS
jgi:hypothetical protein